MRPGLASSSLARTRSAGAISRRRHAAAPVATCAPVAYGYAAAACPSYGYAAPYYGYAEPYGYGSYGYAAPYYGYGGGYRRPYYGEGYADYYGRRYDRPSVAAR